MLLLGTCLGVHGIVSVQDLSENIDILSAKWHRNLCPTIVPQNKHKVPH